MKKTTMLILCMAAACAVQALDIEYDGRLYADCSQTRSTAVGVAYIHTEGIVTIPFDALPAAEQEKYRAAHEKAVKQNERKARLEAEEMAELGRKAAEQKAAEQHRAELIAAQEEQRRKQQKGPEKSMPSEIEMACVSVIATLKQSGLIYRVDTDSHTVIVEPYIWRTLTYDEKDKMVTVVSNYFNCKDGCGYVYVLDKYTNKKLAKLGAFVGFKVYE